MAVEGTVRGAPHRNRPFGVSVTLAPFAVSGLPGSAVPLWIVAWPQRTVPCPYAHRMRRRAGSIPPLNVCSCSGWETHDGNARARRAPHRAPLGTYPARNPPLGTELRQSEGRYLST